MTSTEIKAKAQALADDFHFATVNRCSKATQDAALKAYEQFIKMIGYDPLA